MKTISKFPSWLKSRIPADAAFARTRDTLSSLGLETICTNAACPNIGTCWSKGTATVLILGNICTRNCGFCSVTSGLPLPPDQTEPEKIVRLAEELNLKYIVITSVTRDDLSDAGAGHFRDVIKHLRAQIGHIEIEILTPDFRHCQGLAIEILSEALPFVFSHNIETVPWLYPTVRPAADYQFSLNLLKKAKDRFWNIQTKSSIMLGLGETDVQICQTLADLRSVDCDRLVIGQYLAPCKEATPVVEFIRPAEFDCWKDKALEMGFSWVLSSPFARSSFLAEHKGPQ